MKSTRTETQLGPANLGQNLDTVLALGSVLRSTPAPEMNAALSRVKTLINFQATRMQSQTALQPLVSALDTPAPQRQPLLERLGVAPLQIDGLVLGDAQCPLTLLPRNLAGLSPQARRHHVALQMLVKSNFSIACAQALLRHDKQREMDHVLIVAASQALYLRAHAVLLDAPMDPAVYAALLTVVRNIWLSGVNPDQHVNNQRQGFDGSLVEQALALGDTDAVCMLLESKWDAVERALESFDKERQGKAGFTRATPFIDSWLDTIIDSPLRQRNTQGMAQLARKLVADVGKLMQSKSAALRQHFCEQALIRAASCQEATLFEAVLDGLATHDSYSDPAQLQAMMQFCVLAVWPRGVEVLLEHGVSPNLRLGQAWMGLPEIAIGCTALSLAASCTQPEHSEGATQVIALLLRYGADPRIGVHRSTNCHDAVLLQTALHIALEAGNKDAAALLVQAEIQAPKKFAAQDQVVLAKLRRSVKSTFFTKRGAEITPTDEAMRALAVSYCSLTMDNFHIQAGVSGLGTCRFEEIGHFAVRLAEYIDPIDQAATARARKKERLAQFASLQCAAHDLLAQWPASTSIALPAEFVPGLSLSNIHGPDLLTSKSVNESVNCLFARYISLGQPEAAQLFLDLYPQLSRYQLCMGAAFIVRKSAQKGSDKSTEAAFENLLCHIIDAVREPHGVRILLELGCLLQAPKYVTQVLAHAKAHEIDWPSAISLGLHRNVLHMAVDAPQDVLTALLDVLTPAQCQGWLTQQDEQGDTPLHIAARSKTQAFEPLLEASGDHLRCDIENMAGRCVATEALLHGHLPLFDAIAQVRAEPVASHIFGQAIVAQPRARRRSFIHALEQHAGLSIEQPKVLDAVFATVIARSDAHALRTLVECFGSYVTEPCEHRSTVLHMAAKRPATGMVQHLRNSLAATDFERLARCRDDANCYPEDYTTHPQLHRYLRALRKRAWDGVALELESKHLQTLTPLVNAIAAADQADGCESATQSFIKQAEAIAARQDLVSIDREALGMLAWQVLDMLATAPGPGCGAHYSAHKPDVSLQQLAKRFDAFGSQGASRFGSGDALVLLRLRAEALNKAQAQQASQDFMPHRMIFELTDKRLRGEGYVRNRTSKGAIPYEKSPYVRFVIEPSTHKLVIVSCYPIAELTCSPDN